MQNLYRESQKQALSLQPSQNGEAWALIELARRLAEVRAKDSPSSDEIREIVRLNWRVWTIFQAELVDEACEINTEIRANLLALANFIDKHSINIIRKPQASMLEILVNINRHIGNGLMGRTAEDGDVGGLPAEGALGDEERSGVRQWWRAPGGGFSCYRICERRSATSATGEPRGCAQGRAGRRDYHATRAETFSEGGEGSPGGDEG